MRTLIAIPIIHTEMDMGSLLDQIKQQYVTRYGEGKWEEHIRTIDEVWVGIRKMIAALDLPFPRVRLYQDGLPLCGKEVDIVKEVAARGSTNHQLLLELMHSGGQLMGTEDPRLLVQEYEFHRAGLGELKPGQIEQRIDLSRRLLFDRDHFIAKRINSTLMTGEVGVLFLGLAHAVAPLLNADIVVQHMLVSPNELRGKPP